MDASRHNKLVEGRSARGSHISCKKKTDFSRQKGETEKMTQLNCMREHRPFSRIQITLENRQKIQQGEEPDKIAALLAKPNTQGLPDEICSKETVIVVVEGGAIIFE